MNRRALAIELKAQGEAHPPTATTYDIRALTLRAQGKSAEAEAMLRRTLAIRLKALGEGHPDTAIHFNNLAETLGDQGRHAGRPRRCTAAPWRSTSKSLGEGHSNTVRSSSSLANSLDRRDLANTGGGFPIWRSAAAGYEQARSLGPRGLEVALGIGSPLPGLAAALARADRPGRARRGRAGSAAWPAASPMN